MRSRGEIGASVDITSANRQLQIDSALLEVVLDCRDMLVAIRRELAGKRKKEMEETSR